MAARFLLEASQLVRLLELAGFSAHEAAPLHAATGVAACALDGPEGVALRKRGLVMGDDAPRINSAFAGVLEAAARPEEVLTLQVTGPGQPGFSLCRRGEFWMECTVGPTGTVKFEYPLSRSAMIVAAGAALSSARDEAAPVGFHFRGPGADLAVLHAAVRAGDGGLAVDGLASAIRGYLDAHAGTAVATGLADPAGLVALVTDGGVDSGAVGGAVGAARARLERQELLLSDGGRVLASRAARAALRRPASAGFVASRTTFEGDAAQTSAVQAWRTGDRTLIVRRVRLEDGGLGIDARDIQRAELRALVAAVFSDEETLERATAARS